MTPFFSVILPIYNVKPWLQRCVTSVLTQDFKDFELILVDDGSTDGSGELCDRIAAEHAGIRVVHKINGGLSSARNAGLEVAQGEYIWWVDSDDWIEEGALATIHDELVRNTPQILKFNYIRVDDTHTPVVSCACGSGDLNPGELLKMALIKTSHYVLSAWSHVYSRSFLLENGLRFVSEREIGSEDYLFNLQALLLAQRISVLDKPLYYYELRQGSLSQVYRADLPRRFEILYSKLMEFLSRIDNRALWEPWVNTFYVWHLLRGVCFSNEYTFAARHSVAQGRENVKKILAMPTFRKAAGNMELSHFTWKQKLLLTAMRLGLEPVIYRLYVK